MVKREEFKNLKVTSAPTDPEDVPRKQEHDTKADQDGEGTAELVNYASVETDSVDTTNFTIDGVTFWVSDTEPADAAPDDVWIETNWQS